MNQQRCNHCMSVFNEELTECPECGRDDALMYPFDAEEHTPGPWTIEGEGALAHPGTGASIKTTRIGTGGWGEIELVDGTNESGGGALGNARIIAAAPEMLAALEQVNCLLSNIRSYMPKSIKNRDKYSFELCNAAVNTAIAKAKGE